MELSNQKNIESPVIELSIVLNNDFTINIKANVVLKVNRFEKKSINNKSIKEISQKIWVG